MILKWHCKVRSFGTFWDITTGIFRNFQTHHTKCYRIWWMPTWMPALNLSISPRGSRINNIKCQRYYSISVKRFTVFTITTTGERNWWTIYNNISMKLCSKEFNFIFNYRLINKSTYLSNQTFYWKLWADEARCEVGLS